MSLAICINCGSSKKKPIQECSTCGFAPRSDEDKAKSLILSTAYEIDGDYRGKTKEELLAIGHLLQQGAYSFDPKAVSEVIEYAKLVIAITPRRLITDLVKWIGVPVLILIAAFVILWVTK